MLPRIPVPSDEADYRAFADAGAALREQHLGYESVERYPLTEERALDPGADPSRCRVTKMAFPKKGQTRDRSRIVYNAHLTLAGISEAAYRYQLGSRSAIEWIIDRYPIRIDKVSGIVTVSLETMRMVDSLPDVS